MIADDRRASRRLLQRSSAFPRLRSIATARSARAVRFSFGLGLEAPDGICVSTPAILSRLDTNCSH
jgi:hypothetical protein